MGRSVQVATTDGIPVGRGKLIVLEGLALAIFNAGDGRFYASSARCPHEGGPLADGALAGTAIICPWHGFDFDLRTGACGIVPDLALAVYPVRIEGTSVLVDLP